MNMGEAVIRVTADLTNFTQQQQQIVSESVSTGEKAARGFSDKFGDYLERAKGQLSQKLQKAIDPDGIIRGLNAALETFNAGEGVIASIEAAASSVPLFGSAYKLGKSIGTAIANAISSEGDIAAAVTAEADAMVEYVARRNREQEQIDRELMARGQGVLGARTEGQRLNFDLAIQQAKAEGDLREAAFQEAKKKEFELTKQFEREIRDAKSAEEKQLLEQNFQMRIRLEQEALNERFRQIEADEKKTADARAKADADAAEKRRKEAEDLAEKQRKDAEKIAEDQRKAREKEAKMLEDVNRILDEGAEQRLAAQQQSAGAQTAIGTFTFAAYTDQEKKANDEKIVRGIGELVTQARSGSGGFV